MKLTKRMGQIGMSKKIAGSILLICVISMLGQFGLQHSWYSANFEDILADLEESIAEQQRGGAEDILREVMFATESSLQRDESVQFMQFAEQQAEVEEIKEFSFYGKSGKVELSSDPSKVGEPLPMELWGKAGHTRELMLVESDHTIEFYQPMHVDADMHRLHPDWAVDELYGVLHLEFSKEKVNSMLATAREEYEAGSTSTANLVLLLIGGVGVLAVGLAMVIARTILRPVRRCLESIVALSNQDFEKKCDVDSKDELGRMADAINQSMDATKKAFEDIKEAAKREQKAQEERAEAEQQQAETERSRREEEGRREREQAETERQRQEEQAELDRQQAETERRKAETLRSKVDYLLEIVGAAAQGDLTRKVNVAGDEGHR